MRLDAVFVLVVVHVPLDKHQPQNVKNMSMRSTSPPNGVTVGLFWNEKRLDGIEESTRSHFPPQF